MYNAYPENNGEEREGNCCVQTVLGSTRYTVTESIIICLAVLISRETERNKPHEHPHTAGPNINKHDHLLYLVSNSKNS